jgi:gluconolactonase
MEKTTSTAAVTDAQDTSAKPMSLARRGFLASAAAGVAAATATVTASANDKFQQGRDWTGNHPVTYPEPAPLRVFLDKRFSGRQGDATLQSAFGTAKAATRHLWCEGPVWMGDWGCLLWSDIPNNRVLRWNEENGAVSALPCPTLATIQWPRP